MSFGDIKLTTAQAIIYWLKNQYIAIGKKEERLCAGGFAIFGHGNVTCLGEALYQYRDELPLWRGQNEQSMGLAACAYSKYYKRKRFMFATSSAGPGTTNLLTASSLAHANRLPLLMLCGDTFITRLPDPVLQQLEHCYNPALGCNDAFRSVTRYWDRMVHPAQIMQSLPLMLSTLLDPADCGPAFLGLPQDVQGWTFEYPARFFEPKVHHIRKQYADVIDIKKAVEILKKAKSSLIIAGGGVQYSEASDTLSLFSQETNIPVVETIAGRANMLHSHPLNFGPIGVTGSDSANHLAEKADVILAIGTRLQDFTTGSWTAFHPSAQIIHINVARFDAIKHNAVAVVGDADLVMRQLLDALDGYRSPESWIDDAKNERARWSDILTYNTTPNDEFISYAHVIGAVNRLVDKNDRIIAAAGGLPSELCASWQTLSEGSVDIEFGYSCMGYEIAGAWGASIAQSECEDRASNDVIAFCGDGSYLMMNSDIYSSVLSRKKMILIVCDNGGFGVINKLQNATGNTSYQNLIKDSNIACAPFSVDFSAHARAMGALSEVVDSIAAFEAAFKRAKAADITYVIVIKTDPYQGWTKEGHAWWEVGIAQVSENPNVVEAGIEWEKSRKKQRKGI